MGVGVNTSPYDYSPYNTGDMTGYAKWMNQIQKNWGSQDTTGQWGVAPEKAYSYWNDMGSALKSMASSSDPSVQNYYGILSKGMKFEEGGNYNDWLDSWASHFGDDWRSAAEKYTSYAGNTGSSTLAGGNTPNVTGDTQPVSGNYDFTEVRDYFKNWYEGSVKDQNFGDWWKSLQRAYGTKYNINNGAEMLSRLSVIANDPKKYYTEVDGAYNWNLPWEAYQAPNGNNNPGGQGSTDNNKYLETFYQRRNNAWTDFADYFGGSKYAFPDNYNWEPDYQKYNQNAETGDRRAGYFGQLWADNFSQYMDYISKNPNATEQQVNDWFTQRESANEGNLRGLAKEYIGDQLVDDSDYWKTFTDKQSEYYKSYWNKLFPGYMDDGDPNNRNLRNWLLQNDINRPSESSSWSPDQWNSWFYSLDAPTRVYLQGIRSLKDFGTIAEDKDFQTWASDYIKNGDARNKLNPGNYTSDTTSDAYKNLQKQATEGYGDKWTRSAYESAVAPYAQQYGDYIRNLQLQQSKTGMQSGFAKSAGQNAKYQLASQGVSALSGARQQQEDYKYQAQSQLADINNSDKAIRQSVDQWNKQVDMQNDEFKMYVKQQEDAWNLYQKQKDANQKDDWLKILEVLPYAAMFVL